MTAAPALPQHLEAEIAVLAAVLIAPADTDEVFELLTPGHFTLDRHQVVFRAMVALQAEGKPVDPVSLQAWLDGRHQLESAGGVAFLSDLLDAIPTAANATYHAGIVRDRALERRLIAGASQIAHAAQHRTVEGAELAAEAERLILEATGDVIPGRPRAVNTDLIWDVLEEIQARMASPQRVVGISTGLVDLDELTAGWRPGSYVLIGARPSEGKTALSWFFAQVAAGDGHGVLYISLEMSKEELVERSLARIADIPLLQLHRGFISDHAVTRLLQAGEALKRAPLWVDDAPDRTLSSVRAVARRYCRRENVRMVVLDYVQLLRPDRERENEVQNMRSVSAGLKAMARDLGIPVIVCSQLNRVPEMAKSDRPKLAHLRESGSLEQDADVVILLWNNPQDGSMANPPLTLIVAKQRNGPKGDLRAFYDRATGQFTNWSDRDAGGSQV